MKNRTRLFSFVLSLIYSSIVIIGNSFMHTDSFRFIEKNIFMNILGYVFLIVFFNIILNKIFMLINTHGFCLPKFKKIKNSKIYKKFQKHPFAFSMIFMIICWLPYIISFYPAILSPDPSYQIKQFFNIPNKYSTYAIMIDPKVTITNHHPVVHTLLLGYSVKFGTLLKNVNLGLFTYSIIQILVLSSVLSYSIKFLKEKKINSSYLICMLLVYSFVPVFPFYAMSTVKDVIFGSLVILYIISLYKLSKMDDVSYKKILKFVLLLVLVVLFRNNGIHTIMLSLPLLLLLKKGFRYKSKILLLFITIMGFNYSYNSIILPYFKITPSSIREMLSIPFQQTARYVKEHPKDVTQKEREIIDKVLEYNTLAERYKSQISDPVKNNFNIYTTDEELKNYFTVWFNCFFKHPKTYFESTISNTYGYFYPLKTNWYVYHNFDKRITEDGFDYHYNKLKTQRNVLNSYANLFQIIPPINIFVSIGMNVWILIFMLSYLWYKKKYDAMIYLSPSFVLLLVCTASPVNTYFRYALPYVFALMLNYGLFMKEVEFNEK